MSNIFYVGIGGFIGSACRYLVGVYAPRLLGTRLPYGTLIVNVVGGLLIGLIMDLCIQQNSPASLRLFLTTGILGGFTTFSAFSYETIQLFSEKESLLALLNIGCNLFLSLAAVLCGKYVAHFFSHGG